MQEPIEPDTGITEHTRKMFALIDDLVRPNHVATPVNTHLFHLIGELEALRQGPQAHRLTRPPCTPPSFEMPLRDSSG